MRVTKWGEYGILCSLYIARRHHDGPVGAAEIADGQQIPLQYTQQILQRLRKGNIIKSVRGPKGGYVLSDTPENTTLKAILYAAEGDTFEVLCENHPVYSDRCDDSVCGLRSVWRELKSAVDTLLEQRTLASIMRKEEEAAVLSPIKSLVPGPRASSPK